MARRVNTRFVVGLALGLVVLASALATTWFFVVRADPTELIAKGDALAQQGQFDAAANLYSRALSRRKNDASLVLRYVETINKIPAADTQVADATLRQSGDLLRHALDLDPRNEAVLTRVMEFYLTLGRDFDNASAITAMHDLAVATLKLEPTSAIARKYRGIAITQQMRSLNVPPEKQQQAFEDLSTGTADADATLALASWHTLVSRQAQRQQNTAEQKKHRDLAMATLTQAAVANPSDVRRQLDLIILAQTLDQPDAARTVADRVEPLLLVSPSPVEHVIDLAASLPWVDATPVAGSPGITSGLRRAETLLRAAQRAHPSDQRLSFALGLNLHAQRRTDESLAQLKTAQEQGKPLTALETLRRSVQIQQARSIYSDVLLSTAEAATTPEKKNEALTQAEQTINLLAAASPNSSAVCLLQARLASLRDQWQTAMVKVDQAIALYEARTDKTVDAAIAPALLLSAKARLQLGELGAAAQRLSRVIEIKPDNVPARVELARLLLRTKQFPEAQKQLQQLLTLDKSNLDALQLQAVLLSETGQHEQAIALMRSLDPVKHPQIIKPFSQILIAARRSDEARALLESLLKQQPANLTALQLWLSASPDRARLPELLAAAKNAGAPEAALSLLTAQSQAPEQAAATLERMTESQTDPFRRAIMRSDLFMRQGKTEQARAELSQAAKLKPDDAAVIERQFTLALTDAKWGEAQALAQRAATLNLDAAGGAFFNARLLAQQGKLQQAAAELDKALQQRPIYAEGWRMLGDTRRLLADHAAARAAYEHALQQQPDHVAAMRGLAIIAEQSGNAELALSWYRRALTAAPDDERLAEEYLNYEQARGDANKALAARLARVQAQPADVSNRRATALLMLQLNQVAQAQAMAQELVNQNPDDRDNMTTLAAVQRAAGDEEGFAATIERFIQKRSTAITAADWQSIAQLQARANRADRAMQAYEQAIKLEDARTRPATRELADYLWELGRVAQAAEHYQKLHQQDATDAAVADRLTEAFIQTRRLDEAQALLTASQTQRPSDAKLLILRATLAWARGDQTAAMTAIDQAVELAPLLPMARLKRAELLSTNSQRDAATIAELNKALELDPNLSAARLMLAAVQQRRGERTEAALTLQSLLRRTPSALDARLSLVALWFDAQQWLPLRTLLDESAKLYPSDARWLRLAARAAQASGRVDESLPLLEKALAIDPSPMNLAEVVTFQLRANRADAALASLKRSSQATQESPQLSALLGRALVMTGQRDQGLASFTHAIKQTLSPADALVVTQQMVQAVGIDEALSHLQPLVSTTGLKLELALAQAEADAGRFDASLRRLRLIDAQLSPSAAERPLVDRLLSLSLHQTSQFAEARAVYERMLKRSPTDLQTLNNLAYLLTENLNSAAAAVPLAERAAQISPGDAQVLDTLGWAQFKSGQTEAAAKNLELSVRAKAMAGNTLHLAQLKLARGQKDAAIESLQMSVRLAQENKDAPTLAAAQKQLDELNAPSKR